MMKKFIHLATGVEIFSSFFVLDNIAPFHWSTLPHER